MANADRGKVIYKEYCSQCHGATGKGDGPAASGLVPKPAIHANIPFEKHPPEYLYNVINYGGPAVGKSANMPYWNLTIGQQGVADVVAYLKATFKGAPDMAAAPSGGQGGDLCATAPSDKGVGRNLGPAESAPRICRYGPSGEGAIPQDGSACCLCDVPWGKW